MSVLAFKRNEYADVQHGSGPAFCIACAHEWIAVAPTGTTQLECPKCKAEKGHWKFEFMPKVGDLVRECNCGNQLFYLTTEGHMCANCGIYQSY
jgi:hypothetical protein